MFGWFFKGFNRFFRGVGKVRDLCWSCDTVHRNRAGDLWGLIALTGIDRKGAERVRADAGQAVPGGIRTIAERRDV